ncbi:MAG: hypothetical protein KJ760_16985, partial [Proteobacteria bacterium]|nr:hypothetical protein [Pseudomonadota bacterium]
MKKILILTICNSLLFIATTTISFAYTFAMEDFTGTYTYGNSNQGTYLGTVYSENGSNANDDIATLTNFFNWKGMTVDSLSLYGKDEDGDLFITLSETDDEGQYKSGTWQTFDPSATQPIQPDVISFLIVKGGQSFSVHQYDPSAYSGEWNIGYLD